MKRGRGAFVVVEGLDGSGKGELVKRLQAYVMGKSKRYDHVLLTREPTNGPFGQKLRRLLRTERNPYANARKFLRLYVQDRKWHVRNHILPALRKGYVVICDRYKHSTLAFQQTQGIPFRELVRAHRGLPAPDLTLLLDVRPEIALQRIAKRDGTRRDTFDDRAFMAKLRANYLALPRQLEGERIAVVDANGGKDETFTRARRALDKSRVLPY